MLTLHKIKVAMAEKLWYNVRTRRLASYEVAQAELSAHSEMSVHADWQAATQNVNVDKNWIF